MMPAVLPWLLMLILLALKPNRIGQAWWIWAPLGVLFILQVGLIALSSSGFDMIEPIVVFADIFGAAGFGLGAVWLLSPFLAGRPRPVVFLALMLIQGAFATVSFLAGMEHGDFPFHIGMLLALGAVVLLLALALTLSGWLCKRRYGPARFALWLLALLLGGWLLAAVPFAVFAAIVQGMEVWLGILMGAAAFAVASFAVALPFLVLSFVNAYYHERLRRLLGLSAPSLPPPLIPVAAPGAPA